MFEVKSTDRQCVHRFIGYLKMMLACYLAWQFHLQVPKMKCYSGPFRFIMTMIIILNLSRMGLYVFNVQVFGLPLKVGFHGGSCLWLINPAAERGRIKT
ncbi:hypothetical protein HanPI659440_Chr04g0155841 [Helianthus annuus]|nr:hypothetical protein HanPI659440_Chr04g0155841 [Helianthus annuus]